MAANTPSSLCANMAKKEAASSTPPRYVYSYLISFHFSRIPFTIPINALEFKSRTHHPSTQVVALVGSATPQLAYTASKGAVLALTRELAIVHAKEAYRFNALCPAPLNTPLLQDWLGDDAAKRHRREVHFPMGRFGEAIEQAQAVLWLASDESGFVNGTDFVVDGGMTRAYVTAEGRGTEAPLNLSSGA